MNCRRGERLRIAQSTKPQPNDEIAKKINTKYIN